MPGGVAGAQFSRTAPYADERMKPGLHRGPQGQRRSQNSQAGGGHVQHRHAARFPDRAGQLCRAGVKLALDGFGRRIRAVLHPLRHCLLNHNQN
jgi:hypothetical protein